MIVKTKKILIDVNGSIVKPVNKRNIKKCFKFFTLYSFIKSLIANIDEINPNSKINLGNNPSIIIPCLAGPIPNKRESKRF